MPQQTIGARTAPSNEPPLFLGDGVTALAGMLPVPGAGELATNAFLLEGAEPILVDTSAAALRTGFLRDLSAAVDPSRLRWIWISHLDADHVGNLPDLLAMAPRAQIVSCRLGQAKMGLLGLPVERVHLLEAGESLRTPDRCLLALRPPYYDAPETLGFHDRESGTLFTGDAYGAVLPRLAQTAEAVTESDLSAGMGLWSSLDAPWLSALRTDVLQYALHALEALEPSRVLSSHLPPAGSLAVLNRMLLDIHGAADLQVQAA